MPQEQINCPRCDAHVNEFPKVFEGSVYHTHCAYAEELDSLEVPEGSPVLEEVF